MLLRRCEFGVREHAPARALDPESGGPNRMISFIQVASQGFRGSAINGSDLNIIVWYFIQQNIDRPDIKNGRYLSGCRMSVWSAIVLRRCIHLRTGRGLGRSLSA